LKKIPDYCLCGKYCLEKFYRFVIANMFFSSENIMKLLLGAYMRIIEYINQGGSIMYILLTLNIIGYTIMASKFYILSKERKNVNGIADSLKEKLACKSHISDNTALIELAKQEITTQIDVFEKGVNTVKIIAAISPLLGLLGTVLGVLIAFKVMASSGLTNPESFAEGISMALITTVGGLIVSIPHFIGHNYLIGMIDSLESKLEKALLAKLF
jgi:biopolymer transport protein ExbB